jgi:hypothetical protein
MLCDSSTEAKRLTRREMRRKFFPIYSLYLICFLFYNFRPPDRNSPYAYLLAISMSVSMIGMIVALAIATNRQRDEYQRQLLMQAMMWGIGGSLSITTIWGLLETLTAVPHMPVLMNFPIFLSIAVIAKVILFRANRPVDE